VPENKFWSPEHGHWHTDWEAVRRGTQAAAASTQNQSVSPGSDPATFEVTLQPGSTTTLTASPTGTLIPQPPGPVPPGKVWGPEHGHWHTDLEAVLRGNQPAPAPTQNQSVSPDSPPTTQPNAQLLPADRHGREAILPQEEIAMLPPDGGSEFNRLVFEKSPYLLQHARNPVDWYPWGEDAFEAARREDKPVFLSVGYSTCHWCHVMEEESFEDEEVAALMNEHFVSIKVDREERPDIDNIYMTVTQALTGSGGWPMTVVLTPDGEPFFAGTYFPKRSRFNRPGMMDLLPQLAGAWETRRDEVTQSAQQISAQLRQMSGGAPGEALTQETLDTAHSQLARRYDASLGGFGSAPKFPTPHNLLFLLRHWRRTGDAATLDMVETTLQAMRRGGIFDHVGFGFHRYSTDREWLVPHFEKMLYDQALLAMAFVETYQATRDEFYADTAREIFTYVLRDMTSPEGGFYSAEDADSEGEEGLFYLWSNDQVHEVLGSVDANYYTRAYNMAEAGNFREQSTGRRTGTNIPHLRRSLAETAETLDLPEAELRERIEASRRRLFEARERRIHPLKDDKILTDWNGLMIAALARGAQALGEPRYVEAATRAADFVLARLRDENGRLLKRHRDGESGLPAHLEDHAFMVWGLLDLYEATGEVRHLQIAIELNEIMIRHFWDGDEGGFFLTADDGEELLVRPKEIYDGAIPSGNSVAALNLLRIGRITANSEMEDMAEQVMRAFSAQVSRAPSGHTLLMSALDFAIGPSHEIVIAGDPAAEDTRDMLSALWSRFIPNKVVICRPAGESPITQIAAYTESQTSLDGQATAYVCQNYACRAPTTEIAAMIQALKPEGPEVN
jgi:uncharacterized protein YyaL (SSP411 family)